MGKIRRKSRNRRNRKPEPRRDDSPESHVDDGSKNETTVSENRERSKDVDQPDRERSSDSVRSGSGIELLPLIITPDGWNLNDTFLRNVFKQMQNEGTAETLFYDAKVDTEDDFLQVFASPTNLAVFAFQNADLAAMAWLNSIQHDNAQAHYWFAKKVWGPQAITIGRKILDYWFKFTQQNSDDILFKAIVGQTPAKNRRSFSFNKRLGFTFLGTIPKVMGNGIDIFYLENPYGKK